MKQEINRECLLNIFSVSIRQWKKLARRPSFPVITGDVFLIQKGQKHYFRDLQSFDLINVLYDPELLGFPKSELGKLPGYCALFMLEPQHRKQHNFSSRLHLKHLDLAPAIQIVDKM